ncbi:AAA family ATPase [Aliikangiella coralliicola]|uniref:AAA family ATPase n=1 Tax=Aliikangiella coralliicola TaxID=2592383 RepID=A0A545UHJ6_9GAMM|nr:AAA family ATPase [Aliikangiella coralliicola]TQV88951.1 AAA family ATPase [Aliikangiella coralliicola]
MSYVTIHKSQLLDSLENQILYADLACVIIGQKGIGKSFFLEQIHSRVSGQVSLSQIEAESVMTQAQLEKSISLQLGLSWQESEESLLDKIAASLEQRVLLTIDNAHLLDQSCLDFLMGLATRQLAAKQTLLYMVLTGESDLAEKLNDTPSLKYDPNICVVFELKPIEEQETKFLIAQFQSIDPGTAEALYDEQKLQYFWQLSKGIPGDLKYQLTRWLEQTEVKTKPEKELSSIKKYSLSAVYVVLAVTLVFALIYQDEINQMITPDTANQKTASSKSEQALNSNSKEPQSDKEYGGIEQAATNKSESQQGDLADSTEDKSQNRKSKLPTEEEGLLRNPDPKQEPAKETESGEIAKKTSVVNTTKIGSKDESSGTDTSKSEVSQNKSENQAGVAEVEKKKSLPASSISDDERKLMGMDDARFTLQWIGVSKLEAAENFRQQHPLKESMLIFRRNQSTGILYLIVSGQFNSRIDADNAKAVYLKRGYSGKPWVKSLKAVKQEIAAKG